MNIGRKLYLVCKLFICLLFIAVFGSFLFAAIKAEEGVLEMSAVFVGVLLMTIVFMRNE